MKTSSKTVVTPDCPLHKIMTSEFPNFANMNDTDVEERGQRS